MNYTELVSELNRLNITPKIFKSLFDQWSSIDDICDNCLLSEVFGPIRLIKIGDNDYYEFLKTGIKINIYIERNIHYMQECVVVNVIESYNDLLPFLKELKAINQLNPLWDVLYDLETEQVSINSTILGHVCLVSHIENNGSENSISDINRVIYFENIDTYIKFIGYYTSYDGYEYTDYKVVRPKTKSVVVYE